MVNRKQFDKRFLVSAVAIAITATAVVPMTSVAAGLSDVPPESSHAETIKAAVDMGFIKGQNGKFHPNDTITRGQVVKILARYLENKHGKKNYSKVQPFADVSAKTKDKELYNASRVVKFHESFLGDNNHLRPGDLMTREQMASVLVRAFELELGRPTSEIVDLHQVSSHHRQNVLTLANLGITQTADGRFSPKNAVTRAQFASFFVRTVNGYGGLPNSIKGLKIVSVVELNNTNQFIRLNFSHAIPKLTAADVDIRNAKTGANYAVKEVKLADNGKSAEVELFDIQTGNQVSVGDFHLTTTVYGEKLTYSFNRSTYTESFVTAIDVPKNKFTIYTEKGSTKTLDVPASVKNLDLQKIIGEKVGIWYDGKNKPTDVKIITQKAKYDAIEITKMDEIRLISEDRKYNISANTFEGSSSKKQFTFYLDGKKVEIGDRNDPKKKVKVRDRFTHAKVGFDNSGNILFVSAYNLNEFLIVDRIEGHEVIGYAGEGTGGIFNAKDATIIKDGNAIKPSNLRRGDVLFFSEKGNNGKGIAEVLEHVEKGEIDAVSSNDVRVNGTTYRFKDTVDLDRYNVNYGDAVYLHDDGKTEYIYFDLAKEIQKAGNATVYADRAGNVVYIAGGPISLERKQSIAILVADIVGDRQSAREFIEVEALLATGEKKWFTSNLESLKSIIVDDITYDINNNGKSNWKATFEYKDKIAKREVTAIHLTSKSDKKVVKVPLIGTRGDLVRLHMDQNRGKLETIEFFKKRSANKKAVVKSSDSHISGKRLDPKTIVFDTEYFKDRASDIEITTWGALKGSSRVASMIYDQNNTIIAYITDKPPKLAANFKSNRANLTSEIKYEELVMTTGEKKHADYISKKLGFVGRSTIASADKGKLSDVKISILPLEFRQETGVAGVNAAGEIIFERKS